ncbi:hypothetical protein GCM10012279_16660 [Micromonospora yangpuensis]|nr:hypothetical protein GCM10012279_16660 [Micromonospora yangpuensis]
MALFAVVAFVAGAAFFAVVAFFVGVIFFAGVALVCGGSLVSLAGLPGDSGPGAGAGGTALRRGADGGSVASGGWKSTVGAAFVRRVDFRCVGVAPD